MSYAAKTDYLCQLRRHTGVNQISITHSHARRNIFEVIQIALHYLAVAWISTICEMAFSFQGVALRDAHV